jgi:serine/threonine protein kinase
MNAIVQGNVTAPKDINKDIPVELDEITRKCLELRPNDRYQTAEELAEALKQWLQFSETIARPLDFSVELSKYCIGYSDRPWLFDEVARRMTLPNERLILLTGGMGSGKSAFSAELVRRNPNQRILAWHFCHQKWPEWTRHYFTQAPRFPPTHRRGEVVKSATPATGDCLIAPFVVGGHRRPI